MGADCCVGRPKDIVIDKDALKESLLLDLSGVVEEKKEPEA